MIAIIIATLVCATIILTAYWLRDLALRWLDEGRASEEVAKLREELASKAAEVRAESEKFTRDIEAQVYVELERVEKRVDAVDNVHAHINNFTARLNEIEALARKAEASVREKNVGAALRGTGRS